MAVDQSDMKRAEWKRELRQRLLTASPEEKRQFARSLFAAMIGIFGIRARPDQLTRRGFWGRFGLLGVLVWVGFLLNFIAGSIHPGRLTNSIGSTFLFAIFGTLGLKLLVASVRPFWLCITGRITQATVTSIPVEGDGAQASRSTAIVSFAAENGEQRSALLGEREERPLIDQLAREYPGDTSSRDEAAPPAIGTRMTIVYREGQDRVTQLSIWSFAGAVMGLICAAVVLAMAGYTALDALHGTYPH